MVGQPAGGEGVDGGQSDAHIGSAHRGDGFGCEVCARQVIAHTEEPASHLRGSPDLGDAKRKSGAKPLGEGARCGEFAPVKRFIRVGLGHLNEKRLVVHIVHEGGIAFGGGEVLGAHSLKPRHRARGERR